MICGNGGDEECSPLDTIVGGVPALTRFPGFEFSGAVRETRPEKAT